MMKIRRPLPSGKEKRTKGNSAMERSESKIGLLSIAGTISVLSKLQYILKTM
jgi:hypothetical protein